MQKYTCCFIGHRKINISQELKKRLKALIEELIINKNVNTFLFGSESEFDDLCYQVVSELKEKYPYIKRVYVRAEFLQITDNYKAYLLQGYEDTYYPQEVRGAGKAAYIKRNFNMINKSEICVIYYSEDCLPKIRKSGTKLALDYAILKNKKVMLLP